MDTDPIPFPFLMIPLPSGGFWIIGSKDEDELSGSFEDDIIQGLGGNDFIRGDGLGFDDDGDGSGGPGGPLGIVQDPGDEFEIQFGDDRIYAGRGDDMVIGDDFLRNDRLSASLEAPIEDWNPFGKDAIFGQGGNDMLAGDGGALFQNQFPDDGPGRSVRAVVEEEEEPFPILFFDFSPGNDDVIRGGWGDDDIIGEGGDDKLFGNAGDDRMFGGLGKDHLNGGFGKDILDGGIGADKLKGGFGKDTFVLKQGEIEEQEAALAAEASSGGLLGLIGGLFEPFKGDKILDYTKHDTIVFVARDNILEAQGPQEALPPQTQVFVEALGGGFFEVVFSGNSEMAQEPSLEAANLLWDPTEGPGETFFVKGAWDVEDLKIEVIGGVLGDADEFAT